MDGIRFDALPLGQDVVTFADVAKLSSGAETQRLDAPGSRTRDGACRSFTGKGIR